MHKIYLKSSRQTMTQAITRADVCRTGEITEGVPARVVIAWHRRVVNGEVVNIEDTPNPPGLLMETRLGKCWFFPEPVDLDDANRQTDEPITPGEIAFNAAVERLNRRVSDPDIVTVSTADLKALLLLLRKLAERQVRA